MMSLCRVIGLLTTFALRTTGAPTVGTGTGCETSPAVVGGTGTMTFHFREGLNTSSDIFHAYVIRSGDTANVLQCDRRNEAGITCETINKAFKTTTIENHSLTLQAPHVTPDLAGTYTLWITADGTKELPAVCDFVVRNETGGTPGDKTNVNVVAIVVPIVIILLLLAAAAIVFSFIRRRNNKRRSGSQRQHSLDDIDHSKNSDRSDDVDASSMLLPDENDAQHCDVATKRWYFGSMSPEEEEELSRFKRRNKPGSFLVRDDGSYLLLAVCSDDPDNKRFRIETDGTIYKMEGTDETFDTLPHLIEHYRKHDIIHRGKTAGKLGNPFEVKPKEEWYAGKMSRRSEKNLFRSTGNQPNSFLLRDSITSPGDYTLAVYISEKKKPKHFLISLDVNSFNFCDAKQKFKSLTELVHYYQENDIETTKEGNFGKLGAPIGAQTTGCHCM